MKEILIKEEKVNKYIYSLISPIMMAPIILVRGCESKNYLIFGIGILGILFSVTGFIKYVIRKKEMNKSNAYLMKIDQEGIMDNPFFGRERSILWSEVEGIDTDQWFNEKRLVIEFSDLDAFYERNKRHLRFFEKFALKVMKSPYRIDLQASEVSAEDIEKVIKENFTNI